MKKYNELVRSSNNEIKTQSKVRENFINLGLVIKYIGAFSAASAVILYFLGYIYNQSYLQVWGIDSGVFPVSYKDLIIYGIFPLFMGVSNLLAMIKNLSLVNILLAFAILAIYIFIIITLAGFQNGKPSKKSKFTYPENHPSSKPGKLKMFIRNMLISTWVAFALIFGGLVAISSTAAMIAIPALLADKAGKQQAYIDKKQYDTGCNSGVSSEKKCTTLKDNRGMVITGYVIQESTNSIAIYDVIQHAVLVKRTSDIVEQKTEITEKGAK